MSNLTALAHQTSFFLNGTGNVFTCDCADINFIHSLSFFPGNFQITCTNFYNCSGIFCRLNLTPNNTRTCLDKLLVNCYGPSFRTLAVTAYTLYGITVFLCFFASVCLRFKWHVLYAWYLTKFTLFKSNQGASALAAAFNAFV